MYADRVDVFHVADGYYIPFAVPHHLILNFLPACDPLFNQSLPYSAQPESIRSDFNQLGLISGDAAAGSAKGIRRSYNYRIIDFICEGQCILYRSDDLACYTWLTDPFHCIFEGLSVLGHFYRFRSSSEKLDALFFQKAGFGQFHRKIEAGLSTQCRQQAVRFFFQNDLSDRLHIEWLYINSVRYIRICHDRGRIAVDKHYLYTFLFECLAGLRSGIVELCRLSDYDRSGTDDHYFTDIITSWHADPLPLFSSFPETCQTGMPCPQVQARLQDGIAR